METYELPPKKNIQIRGKELKCSVCGEIKPLEFFYQKKKVKKESELICKICKNIQELKKEIKAL